MYKALRVLIISILTLSLSSAMADNDSHVQSLRGSNAAMLSLMENQFIRQAYREMQYNELNTKLDSELREYFESHPLISSTFSELTQVQEMIVEDFIKQAEMSMYRIREHSPGELGRLDKIIVETMVSLGFSREAIKNRKTYLALGEVNAFTVSGSENHPIVVVNTGLLEKLGDLEAKAVIAHEFGHILSKHTIISIVSRVLLNFTGAYLTHGKMALQSIQSEMNSIVADLKNLKTCTHADHSHMHELMGEERTHFTMSDSDKALNAALGKLMSANPSAILEASVQFLTYVTENGRGLYLRPQTIGYFKKAIEVIKLNAQDPAGEALLNTKDFPVHAKEVIEALSRVKEKSADHFSGAIIPNEIVASAFLKLVGPNSFKREDRKVFFADIQQQVREFMQKYDYEKQIDAIGSTHPALNLRITDILNIKKYPSLAIANPFLRLMMIREQVVTKSIMMAEVVSSIEMQLKQIEENGLPEEVKKKLTEEQQVEAIKQAEEALLQYMIEAEGYEKAISVIESEILGLMINFEGAKRNPRIENIIQFLSFEKELKFYQSKLMAAELEKPEVKEDAEKAQYLKQMIAGLQQAAIQDDAIIDSLLAKLPKNSQYIDLLSELKAVASMEDGEALRAKITNFKKHTSLPRSADPNNCEALLSASFQ